MSLNDIEEMLDQARSDWEENPCDRAAYEWMTVLRRHRDAVRVEVAA